MDYKQAYSQLLEQEVEVSSAKRADRIRDGLGHAEELFLRTVWWPAFQNFDGLHPEYELRDYDDGLRFVDFAYLFATHRVAIEIDGFGPHWRDIHTENFSDHERRNSDLTSDKWLIHGFAYADVKSNPRYFQRKVQQIVGQLRYEPAGEFALLKPTDREIVRLALGTDSPITVADVMKCSYLARNAAMRHLRFLVKAKWLESAGEGKTRIDTYRICASRSGFRP